ncbi:MAG: hypothetical protein ACREWJ_11140 [Rhodoferax sp.]
MPELQLAVIDVKPGAALESQSGLQLLRPRIYGAYASPAGPKRTAAIVMHPASQMGRITSLTGFLSQWSSHSRADGPANLARTSVPVLLCTYTADQSTFPSTRDAWMTAGGSRIRNVDIRGGNHYLAGQAGLITLVADEMAAWMHRL